MIDQLHKLRILLKRYLHALNDAQLEPQLTYPLLIHQERDLPALAALSEMTPTRAHGPYVDPKTVLNDPSFYDHHGTH